MLLINAYCVLSARDRSPADNRGVDERSQPSRRASLMRLLAAALAGAIGAFGVPLGLHAAQQQSTATSAQAPAAAPDLASE